jgi:hypothetical protein
MNKRVIFTVAGAMLLFGGPLVLPAPQLAQLPSVETASVKPA